jgi:putative oxidoreductase
VPAWECERRKERDVTSVPSSGQCSIVIERLLSSRVQGGGAAAVALARVAAGVVFVVFGIGKFSQHATEVDSFRTYGLPSPDAFVYAVGALEIVGGLMLIAGLLTRLAALALAGDMVGAIVVSGIKEREAISLTLAPALLVTMVVLLWTGAGARSADARLR